MKKIYLVSIVTLFLIPTIASAAIVTCTGEDCTFDALKTTLTGVVDYIIENIVPGLLIIFIAIGGLLLLFSGGNPGLASLGKKTLLAAAIGAGLALMAWGLVTWIESVIKG